MKSLALAATFLLASAGAFAQAQAPAKVFRCTDAKGAIIYTDRPDLKCKSVRVDTPPAAPVSPKPAAKAREIPKPRTVTTASGPRTQKTHCAALSKAAADYATGKTGGLDAAAVEQRRASIEKAQATGCGPDGKADD